MNERILFGTWHWSFILRPIAAVVLCFYMAVSSPVLAVTVQLFYESRPAMGTSFEVYVYAPDRERASELFEAAFDEIERVEQALSNYRSSSELSRINAVAADTPVVTDPEFFSRLDLSCEYSRRC